MKVLCGRKLLELLPSMRNCSWRLIRTFCVTKIEPNEITPFKNFNGSVARLQNKERATARLQHQRQREQERKAIRADQGKAG